jgi:hypothetical protein
MFRCSRVNVVRPVNSFNGCAREHWPINASLLAALALPDSFDYTKLFGDSKVQKSQSQGMKEGP